MHGATKATCHQGILGKTLQEMLQLRGKRRHCQLNETYNFGTKGAKKIHGIILHNIILEFELFKMQHLFLNDNESVLVP